MLAIRVAAASAHTNLLGGGCSKEPNRLNGPLRLKQSLQFYTAPHHVTLQAPTHMRGSDAVVT